MYFWVKKILGWKKIFGHVSVKWYHPKCAEKVPRYIRIFFIRLPVDAEFDFKLDGEKIILDPYSESTQT